MSKSKHFKSPYLKTSIAVSKSLSNAVNPAYEIYLNSLAMNGRKSMLSMLGQASRILGWQQAPGYYPWHELSYQKLHQVRAKMLELDYSNNSTNLVLCGLKSISRTAFNLELMSADQLMRIQAVQTVKGEVLRKGRSLSDSDIKSLLKACGKNKSTTMIKRDKAMLLLILGAGLRASELIALNIEDFDTDTGKIRIMRGKGRKQREVHLSGIVLNALQAWLNVLPEGGGALFREIRKSGKIYVNRLSKQGLAKILLKLQIDAGIKNFSPHDLRRTFITKLLDEKIDINRVRQLAGHSSVNTTALYDRRDEKGLVAASRGIRF